MLMKKVHTKTLVMVLMIQRMTMITILVKVAMT